MSTYSCIFFDLDHTLWDYETNARETLLELFHQHALHSRGVADFESFLSSFRTVNAKLWDLYDREMITSDVIRKERFGQILSSFGIHDGKFSEELSVAYLRDCPRKGNLMPQALDTLDYLSKKYNLTVITNGFEEIQHVKMRSAGIDHFFDHVVTSQKAGCRKPAKGIFEHALRLNAVGFHEVVMVGDNLITDIDGAHNAGIETVYFNPDATAHTQTTVKREIRNLQELCSFL